MKTSDLTGAALDWAVAKCEGLRVEYDYQYTEEKRFDGWWQLGPNHWQPLRKYSSDWPQGGPIIEREKIEVSWRWDVTPGHTSGFWSADYWPDEGDNSRIWASGTGATILIAAMRCFVASRLGNEVKIPDILGETR